jgi:hypothetical protein
MLGSCSVGSLRPVSGLIVGMLLAALCCNPVRAEILVQGRIDAVRLEARDATVADILAALGARFELRFRGPTRNRPITATYEGPLRRIVARVLDGYDYVIEPRGAGIEVIVLSSGSTGEATPAAPAIVVHRR